MANELTGTGTHRAFLNSSSTYIRRQAISNQISKPVPTVPRPPYQFLGWKYALSRGGDYLARFTRGRTNTLTAVTSSGISTTASVPYSTPQQTPVGATPAFAGFILPSSLPANFIPSSVATGDFNGDGNLDWVVANAGSSDLWLYLGKGDGTASLPIIIPLQGQSPSSVTAADLRKIGVLDLAVHLYPPRLLQN